MQPPHESSLHHHLIHLIQARVVCDCLSWRANEEKVVNARNEPGSLSTETVQGAALSLESVDDIEGGDGLSLGVLGVGDCVSDDALEEGLQDTAGFLVDHGRDTLDTATTRETTDGGLGYALDVVTENLSVTLGSAFAEALSTFSASSHVDGIEVMR